MAAFQALLQTFLPFGGVPLTCDEERAVSEFKGRHFQGGILDEARMIEHAFDLGPCAMAEAQMIVEKELAKAA